MTMFKLVFLLATTSIFVGSCAPPPSRHNPNPAPNSGTQTPETTNPTSGPMTNDGVAGPVLTPTPDTMLPIPPGWSLRSPALKSTSSDTSPLITGSELKDYANGVAQLYKDAACTQLLAENAISEAGLVTFTTLRFKADKSDDGPKKFYLKTKTDKKTSTCEDSKLEYTLKTDVPEAKSKYYRLTLKSDPATTMNIGFAAASSSMTDAKIFYDTDDHGRDAGAYPMFKTLDSNKSLLDMNNAFAELTQLKPDSIYYFVIQDASGVSPTFSFRTLPNNPATPIAIITGGDSRDNRVPRKNANLLVSKLRAHAVFFGGDMTNLGTSAQWKEWMEDWQSTIASDGRMTPVVVARGNHESSNEIPETLFNTPKGVYYALTLGGSLLRFYTLNSESSVAGTQSEWLKEDLKKNPTEIWRMAQYHKPMRPHVNEKVDGTSQYNAWAGIFHEYKMNVIVESDAHTVKSTWPIKPSTASGNDQGFIRDDATGTVYIGEGCWGAPLRTADDVKKWTRDSGSFNHFNWIFIDQTKMDVRTVKVDNAESVASLKDGESFKMPQGIDIWTPANGALISIPRRP